MEEHQKDLQGTEHTQSVESVQAAVEKSLSTQIPDDFPRLVLYPDIVLRQVSEPVTENDDIQDLIKKLVASMYLYRGIGLSAIQLGIPKRVMVWDWKWLAEEHAQKYTTIGAMINPSITENASEDCPMLEGCLSIPGIEGAVWRPREITVEYTDMNGNQKTMKFDGLDARIIQHEIDHMDGKLFIDRMPPQERQKLAAQLMMIRRAQESARVK